MNAQDMIKELQKRYKFVVVTAVGRKDRKDKRMIKYRTMNDAWEHLTCLRLTQRLALDIERGWDNTFKFSLLYRLNRLFTVTIPCKLQMKWQNFYADYWYNLVYSDGTYCFSLRFSRFLGKIGFKRFMWKRAGFKV